MSVVFFMGVIVCYWAEGHLNAALHGLNTFAQQGNLEGKETRFVANSALYAVVTNDASCGAVNAMHDSFHAARWRLVPPVNIALGEVQFWRRGRGTLRGIGLRDSDGVHRRLDGGPHAGISGKEDRSARNEIGDALYIDIPVIDSRLRGVVVGIRIWRSLRWSNLHLGYMA